jgi:uncharacterized membrane protein YgdD (TMEM256/DUF423 family)
MGRWTIIVAGLFGAFGVATAAGAAHGIAGLSLASASLVLLGHAPILVVLGLLAPPGRLWMVAGLLLIAGTALFAGDMGWRAANRRALFPMAAPGGGILLIAGWVALSVAGWTHRGASLP